MAELCLVHWNDHSEDSNAQPRDKPPQVEHPNDNASSLYGTAHDEDTASRQNCTATPKSIGEGSEESSREAPGGEEGNNCSRARIGVML